MAVRQDIEDAIQRADRIEVFLDVGYGSPRKIDISKEAARTMFEAAPIGNGPRLDWDGSTLTLFPAFG